MNPSIELDYLSTIEVSIEMLSSPYLDTREDPGYVGDWEITELTISGKVAPLEVLDWFNSNSEILLPDLVDRIAEAIELETEIGREIEEY